MMSLSLAAIAGEKGNGGDAVVCRDAEGEIKSVELLDYYEGRVLRKLPVMEFPEMTDEEFFLMFEDLIYLDEHLFQYFQKESLQLMNAIRNYLQTGDGKDPSILFTDDRLRDVPDSGELIIKDGCKVEQLAIWLKPQFYDDPAFIIQANLLKHMSQKDLRGLVLHEILYKMLWIRAFHIYQYDMTDSISARYLHQKLLSKPLEKFNFKEYVLFLRGVCNWKCGDILRRKGKSISIYNIKFLEDGTAEATVKGSDVTFVLNAKGELDRDLTLAKGNILVHAYTQNQFSSQDPGKVGLNTSVFGYFWIPLVSTQNFGLMMPFGENEISVSLNKHDTVTPVSGWGIQFKTSHWREDKMNYVIMAAGLKPEQQVFKKKFKVDLDKNFEVVITELN